MRECMSFCVRVYVYVCTRAFVCLCMCVECVCTPPPHMLTYANMYAELPWKAIVCVVATEGIPINLNRYGRQFCVLLLLEGMKKYQYATFSLPPSLSLPLSLFSLSLSPSLSLSLFSLCIYMSKPLGGSIGDDVLLRCPCRAHACMHVRI